MAAEEKSPFENFIENMISGQGLKKVKDIHPEDFMIIMDSIYTLLFKHEKTKNKKSGIEGLTNYSGLKIEFSEANKYPSIRRDLQDNYKIIVLPDKNESEELKLSKVNEALKEFDCLETIEKYELCLRIFNSFTENELTILAKEFDPYKRDTRKLEERLKKRALNKKELE